MFNAQRHRIVWIRGIANSPVEWQDADPAPNSPE
jgi:hypothetical protein